MPNKRYNTQVTNRLKAMGGGMGRRMYSKGTPKPDFLDIDGDKNKKESMKKAAADKKKGSPAKMEDKESPAKMGHKKSPAKMGHKDSPAKKFDRVVLGGNKGDKSKTKPGKKDYEK